MNKKIHKLIVWTPRILSIIFILFLFLMSLDVFEGSHGFGEILLGLLIHNIPGLILLGVLIISWKHEIVGGIAFILAGFAYLGFELNSVIRNGFEWYYLSWLIQISGIAFLIGTLFLVGWHKKKQ